MKRNHKLYNISIYSVLSLSFEEAKEGKNDKKRKFVVHPLKLVNRMKKNIAKFGLNPEKCFVYNCLILSDVKKR